MEAEDKKIEGLSVEAFFRGLAQAGLYSTPEKRRALLFLTFAVFTTLVPLYHIILYS